MTETASFRVSVEKDWQVTQFRRIITTAAALFYSLLLTVASLLPTNLIGSQKEINRYLYDVRTAPSDLQKLTHFSLSNAGWNSFTSDDDADKFTRHFKGQKTVKNCLERRTNSWLVRLFHYHLMLLPPPHSTYKKSLLVRNLPHESLVWFWEWKKVSSCNCPEKKKRNPHRSLKAAAAADMSMTMMEFKASAYLEFFCFKVMRSGFFFLLPIDRWRGCRTKSAPK